ncbi:hypothetical protein BB560_002385 [Smittium megazygosporum]|uniref:MHD domain-containing protein n=1 Tax=Smittium megazygosporum TaxID=133381 RepID=A0A2T9ZEX8_9FUNG|nr:hypothetical protein BB560_002385 [Smittium megazygosporum]
MKSFLSGMPECKLGLSYPSTSSKTPKGTEKPSVENTLAEFQFHQCVRLRQFNQNKAISFVPPDGQFELMRYHFKATQKPPFTLYPVVPKPGPDSQVLNIMVTIKSNYLSKYSATNVKVNIPVPKNTTGCSTNSSISNRAKYSPETNSVVWAIPKFSGNSEHTIDVKVKLSKKEKHDDWQRPPITVSFKLSMLSMSGLQVKFLQIQETGNYKSGK